jgi:hypothetical protein
MTSIRIRAVLAAVLIAIAGLPVLARAQTVPLSAGLTPPAAVGPAEVRTEIDRLRSELEHLRVEYDRRLQALEAKLGNLEAAKPESPDAENPDTARARSLKIFQVPPPAQVPPPTQPPPDQPPLTPAQPPPGLSSKVFNPDISVIGNFVGVAGKNPLSDQPSMELTEVEAAFQAVIDPYARADFFLAASPEGLEVEEGFVTFTALPKNLLLKAGKLRAQFGKVNTLHTHMLPTADRPLVTGNLVGGEEGLSDAGLSLAYLVNNPILFLEATGEVYRGESEVFQSSDRSRLAYVGRLRAYRDITEDSNIDVGASVAFGPTDVGLDVLPGGVEPGVLDKRLFGIDATFRYRPLRRAIYRRLNLRTELIWSRQDLPDDARANAFGFYAVGEYQFARRWYVGARADRSGRALESSLTDTGASLFLTFWPTEFSQIRGQYRRTNFAEGISGNEFLFQFNFSIGAHGAHIF